MQPERLLGGDIRALAKAISRIEAREPGSGELIQSLWRLRGEDPGPSAHVIGLTGPPGSGKSTMVDALTSLWREQGRRVAVLAVDPNSPFSGGAILGDRVRMQRHALDAGVFIRSMGSRGHLGGVSLATRGAVRLLDAAGWEMILVETVGVGQSELEVCEIADSVVVVTTPAGGDGVQVIKAGITEIADLFAVNKADLPGVERVTRELRDLVRVHPGEGIWRVPVVPTIAAEGKQGISELALALDQHRQHLLASGEQAVRAGNRVRDEVVELLSARAAQFARSALAQDQPNLMAPDPRSEDPEKIAAELWGRLGSDQGHNDSAGDQLAAPLERNR